MTARYLKNSLTRQLILKVKSARYMQTAHIVPKDQEESLAGNGFESQIHEKGARNRPLTDEQKASNRIKSKIRARVEHVFGAQHAMGGHIVRTIGIVRARAKIGMMNLVYNMRRLVQLIKRDAIKVSPQQGYISISASLAA